MAKAKQGDNAFIGIGIALLLFSPFLLLSVFKFYNLKSRFMSGTNFHRVIDIGTLKQPLMGCAGLVLISYFAFVVTSNIHKLFGVVTVCIATYAAFMMAQWVAVKYIGAIIDADKRYIYFPPDMQSYGVEDYLKCRFLQDMANLDEVRIDSINRITRQAGKKLYLHGDFGSRAIAFSDKQKRDECMTAIQHLVGKGVVMYEMEQSGYS